MENYIVSIEKQGRLYRVGSISGQDHSEACFLYAPEYLESAQPAAISISLPLQKEPFSPVQTKTFFEGLLPEGFTRRSVAQWMHLDENNYLSILYHLGRECLGALCISREGDSEEATYEKLSVDQVRQLAEEGATKSAEMVTRAHLSLTGASGKAGLYYDDAKNEWYLPKGMAPSTHIVKQSHIRLDGIVTNEQLSLLTAKRCGIAIPDSFIVNTGNGGEGEVLLATRRYDRLITDKSPEIDGLKSPFRLHQEDFAQAMGIPASEKYERETGHFLRTMFGLIRRYSADPIHDQLRLWDMIVFNYLVGNTDGHVKNLSLLYSPDMRTVRLAPAYDILSTTIYETSTREMAFAIGGARTVDEVTEDSFRAAAKEAGIAERMAMRRFDAVRKKFREALEASAAELEEKGFYRAANLKERILASGGIGRI